MNKAFWRRHQQACQHQAEVRQAMALERAAAELQHNTAPIVRVEADHAAHTASCPAHLVVIPYTKYLVAFMPEGMVMTGVIQFVNLPPQLIIEAIQVVNLPPRLSISEKVRKAEEFFTMKLLGKTAAEADQLFPEPVDYCHI